MNPLRHYFQNNSGRLIHKWDHYFDVYHRHFERFRGRPVKVLEFGVFHGGSLQMWKWYFGDLCQVVGVDINSACKTLEEDRVQIEIGDQEDRQFLRSLAEKYGSFDIVIDDGGHTMGQQIATYEELLPAISENGVYLVEDLLTSYRLNYGGGLQRSGTFIEYSKNLIDRLNGWHSQEPEKFGPTEFTRSVWSMHYYDSVLVIEKAPRQKPWHEKTGRASF